MNEAKQIWIKGKKCPHSILEKTKDSFLVRLHGEYTWILKEDTIFVSGRCFIAEIDTKPKFNNESLFLRIIDLHNGEFIKEDTKSIEPFVIKSLGSKLWLIVDEFGNQYYTLYTNSIANPKKLLGYVGVQLEGKIPTIGKKYVFSSIFLSKDENVNKCKREVKLTFIKVTYIKRQGGNFYQIRGYEDTGSSIVAYVNIKC